MSTIPAGEAVKFSLAVGVDSYSVHGRILASDTYGELFAEMSDLDFLIFVRPEPRMPNLFLIDMDKVFGLGNAGPMEPILPGDQNYDNVLREEKRNGNR